MANIAQQKPIIEQDWQRPEEITNGNYINYNSTIGFTHSNWPRNLTLDLGHVYDIETIRFLLWDKSVRGYKYRLLTSIDSFTWNLHYDTNDSSFNGWQEFCFTEKINARFIRIHCLWNSANIGFHIVELQVYNEGTENLNLNITNKKEIRKKTEDYQIEVGSCLPLTQQMNNLTNRLEQILNENTIINPKPFQEIITNFRIQAFDIESLEKSIDSIRREIINPVRKELEDGKKLGRFSVWGFYIGFAGIIVSLFAILNGVLKWI